MPPVKRSPERNAKINEMTAAAIDALDISEPVAKMVAAIKADGEFPDWTEIEIVHVAALRCADPELFRAAHLLMRVAFSEYLD